MRAFRVAVLAAALGAAALSAAQAPPRYGCDSPESKQLDFWLGEWELSYANGGKTRTTTWEIDYRRVK